MRDFGPDGLVFHSADEAWRLELGGWAQVENRVHDLGRTNEHDDLLLRRMRPYLQATAARYFDFRLMFDFGQYTATLQDAFADIHYWPEFRIRGGKFKEPVGLERLEDDRYIKFAERATPSQLVPDRDLGFDLHGILFGRRLEYAVGMFGGRADNTAASRYADHVLNEFAGRLFFHPFAGSERRSAANLGMGLAGTIGNESGAALDSFNSPGGRPFFEYSNGVSAAGTRYRIAPQFNDLWGPLAVLGEFVENAQTLSFSGTPGVGTAAAAPSTRTIANHAWQLTGGWMLTGEDNSFGPIEPRHNFDYALGALGAWEVVARLDQLVIDRTAFADGFAAADASAHAALEWAAGVNWYLNRYLRFQLDYTRCTFDGGGPAGHNLPVDSTLISEVQVQF